MLKRLDINAHTHSLALRACIFRPSALESQHHIHDDDCALGYSPRYVTEHMAKFLKNLFDKKGEKVDLARRFELLARVGQGSMSKVWRARDSMSGRILAIKVLDKAKTDRFEARFQGLNKPREGVIASSLQHLNIVKTIEFGTTTADEPYLVMEFVEGLSLSYLVDAQNEQMKENCLNYIIQIGEAVDYLHRQNWIHRDLCPRNVMVDQDNIVKLIDFGLVVPNTPDFQKPGNRTGTANYMAPELIKRQRTDHRLDVYSFAVTAYEMYTKKLPWDVAAQETLDTVLQHMNKPPRPIDKLVPNIDQRVAEVIMRGLKSNPDDRWSTLSEMLVPLRKAHEDIEKKKVIERKRKAAVAKSQPASVSAQAKSKPDETDDFYGELFLGKAAKSNSTGKRSAGPVSTTNAVSSSQSKPVDSRPSPKPESIKPSALAITEDDEFDGIEIEVEGHYDTPDDDADEPLLQLPEDDETPTSALAVKSQPILDDDDLIDGIEIEVDGPSDSSRP